MQIIIVWLIGQHHFTFIAVLLWYRVPSLNLIFRDLDVTAVHLSALVRTLPGRRLHRIVYYMLRNKPYSALNFSHRRKLKIYFLQNNKGKDLFLSKIAPEVEGCGAKIPQDWSGSGAAQTHFVREKITTIGVPQAWFEQATTRSSVWRSPKLSY
jgi:hypothetical protein